MSVTRDPVSGRIGRCSPALLCRYLLAGFDQNQSSKSNRYCSGLQKFAPLINQAKVKIFITFSNFH